MLLANTFVEPSVLVDGVLLPLGSSQKRPVQGFGGFPPLTLLPLEKHTLPLLMLDLSSDVGGDGFFDCWHHVVHHVDTIPHWPKNASPKSKKVIHNAANNSLTTWHRSGSRICAKCKPKGKKKAACAAWV